MATIIVKAVIKCKEGLPQSTLESIWKQAAKQKTFNHMDEIRDYVSRHRFELGDPKEGLYGLDINTLTLNVLDDIFALNNIKFEYRTMEVKL